MLPKGFEGLRAELAAMRVSRAVGRVTSVEAGVLHVAGLGAAARLGDRVRLRAGASRLYGEVLRIGPDAAVVLPEATPEGVSLGERVELLGPATLAPDAAWIGRVIDPYGRPLDGRPLPRGPRERDLHSAPPPPADRRGLGGRLATGMSVFNTLLPIVEGQRLGLFAGAGVGKSSLLAHFARHLEADLTVVALIGERGRELGEFTRQVLGPEGMARSIVIAATSDQSPLTRRRCAWAAMTVAEHFRDAGRHVLFLADSITRFAEAHREIAVLGGELPALRGHPPSTAHMITQLCERAGPGTGEAGTITAILSVLVAGSDMEEPVADILRGVLDGHVVLDRRIAERGRFPAIDLLRSVSRALPAAASEEENATIGEARALLASYEGSEAMIRAGLYATGADPQIDRAIRTWPDLDAFIGEADLAGVEHSFDRLRLLLRRGSGPAREGVHVPPDRAPGLRQQEARSPARNALPHPRPRPIPATTGAAQPGRRD